MTDDARWTALFDRIALFLTLLAFLLRLGLPNSTAGFGLNLFIHLLFWVALTLWFAGRALGKGGVYRFTGFEFAFLAFAVVSLLSVLRAGFKLTAVDHAFAFLSLSLLFILAVQVLGKQQLLAILLATLFTLAIYALVQYLVLFPQLQKAAETTMSVELARRIRTNEVFATLAGPNQFAGFLALLLPLAVGSLIDTRKYLLRGATILLGLVALALTGSLGGWVALGAGAATMAGLALTRTRGRAVAVAAGGGAVALAVVLLLTTPLLSAAAARSHSMHVRAVYWRATGPMIASAPLLGVGLDNWQEHYFQTKSEVQQETTKTHNDYLQILAETGILGFLAFAAILALGLRRALVRVAAPAADPDPPSPWLVAGVLGLLMLLGLTLANDLLGRMIAIVLGALWLAFWLLLRRTPPPSDLTWTRMGAAGGFVALLVHMFVDFEIYQFGVAAALLSMLALLALLRGGAAEIPLSKTVCLAATGVLMAVSLPLLAFLSPRAMAADNELSDAREVLYLLDRDAAPNPTQMLSEALRVAESAQAHDPYDPEAYLLFARLKFHEWRIWQKVGAKNSKELETIELTALQALDNAIALRPNSSPLHDRKAGFHLEFRRRCLKAAKESGYERAKAAEHLRLAVEEQRRAYELYPTIARNAYLLARVLEIARDPDAPRYYKEALRLSELAGRELENLDRLKLDTLEQVRALRASGKPLEAHDVLDGRLRKAIQGLPPAEARARLERYVRSNEDEMEEGLTPVIKDVVDAIMRDLK
jgi:O-antigen ligase